jgi:hypothetical protein
MQKLEHLQSVRLRYNYLFEVYVQQMFTRREEIPQPYTQQQTMTWLTWLARRMTQYNQMEFWLERMQPEWLETKKHRWGYRVGNVLIVGLESSIKPTERLRWSWREARSGLIFGLRGGLIGGLIFGLIGGLMVELIVGLSVGLDVGLIAGLIAGPIGGLIGGLIAGLIFGPIGGLIGGLIAGLIFGLSGREVQAKTIPNQGIWQSGRSAIIIGLIAGLITGLIFGLSVGLSVGLIFGLSVGLIFGLIFGLVGGLIFGGDAFIQHFTLRFILWRTGQLPWRLVPFLDYCVERIFLRRAGGGYIFVHRLLLEYFANLEVEQ